MASYRAVPASPFSSSEAERSSDEGVAREPMLHHDLVVEAVEADGVLVIAFAKQGTKEARATESTSYLRSLAVDPLLSIRRATESGCSVLAFEDGNLLLDAVVAYW